MNTYRESSLPCTHLGGVIYSTERFNFFRQENFYCMNLGEAGILARAGLPWGNLAPIAWRLPLKGGAIAATSNNIMGLGGVTGSVHYGMPLLAVIVGTGGISSALASLGMQLLATITGTGGISSAIGNLLAEISATLTGTGGITTAQISAYLYALATLSGNGQISSAEAEGVGELLALLSGDGDIASTLIANGELSASIKSYGEMTAEGIRDAIWSAVATNYNVSGTMGQKLNSAAVGGVDYDALAEAVLDAEVSGRNVGSLGKTVEDTKKKANMIPGLY